MDIRASFLASMTFALLVACGDGSGGGPGGNAGNGGSGGGGAPAGGGGGIADGAGGAGGVDDNPCGDSPPGASALATTAPFTETPVCDPIGSWTIAVEPTDYDPYFVPTSFEVSRDDEGRLVVASLGIKEAQIGPDGCDLTLAWYDDSWDVEFGECFGCIADFTASAALDPETGAYSGTMHYSETGDCGGETGGTFVATRTP